MNDLDIARLSRIVAELDALHLRLVDLVLDQEAALDRTRGLLIHEEAERAVRAGTLAEPSPETPTQITHNLPPDAPR